MWLVGFVLALTAALIYNAPRLLQSRRKAFVVAGLVLLVGPWVAGFALKGHAWTSPSGAPLSVAAIQGNVAQSMKWDPAELNAQLALYRDLSFRSKPVDLLIWPETAVPVLKESAEGYLSMMGNFAAERKSALITGVPIREMVRHEKRFFNGITVVGEGDGTYLKQKLVPFGEYVPLQDVLRGLIAFFDLPMSDFARGPADQALLQAKGYQIAPFICYEVVYPDFAAGLSARSDLLLTISNDTWFGTSIGPLQHLQMAQMRALEAGRWMIRATNNGVTGLINPFGQITEQIPQFEQGVLYGEVVPMHNLTPYLQYRSWPLMILCLLLFGWALMASRISKTL
jgi:apolipoprotein N-acyltransferase